MSSLIPRRAVLAMLAASALTACGGVKPYQDQGAPNLELVLKSAESGFLARRKVFLDVWTGPKGPGMAYLGTREFGAGRSQVGLPVGQPLHLALAFEENAPLMGAGQTDTIELPMQALKRGEAWRITVSFDRAGFDHDLRRVR